MEPNVDQRLTAVEQRNEDLSRRVDMLEHPNRQLVNMSSDNLAPQRATTQQPQPHQQPYQQPHQQPYQQPYQQPSPVTYGNFRIIQSILLLLLLSISPITSIIPIQEPEDGKPGLVACSGLVFLIYWEEQVCLYLEPFHWLPR